MEELDRITPAKVQALTRKLVKAGPAILSTDKRNRNGFTAFLFCFYRQFNQLNDEEKELYVGGQYQLVPIIPTAANLEIPDNVDEDDDDDALMVEFFRQQTQAEALTSLERASIHQRHLSTVTAGSCRVWGGYAAATKAQFKWIAADLNEITISGMLLQFPDFFYSMCKKNDLQETILQCMYLEIGLILLV